MYLEVRSYTLKSPTLSISRNYLGGVVTVERNRVVHVGVYESSSVVATAFLAT